MSVTTSELNSQKNSQLFFVYVCVSGDLTGGGRGMVVGLETQQETLSYTKV